MKNGSTNLSTRENTQNHSKKSGFNIPVWIDRIWQQISTRVFVRFEFYIPVEEIKSKVKQGNVVFTLTEGGLVDWLILTSWSRKIGLDAILISNRKRILFFSKPKYFFEILFRRKSYADLFLAQEETGPRLLFCRPKERKKLYSPTPVEKLLSILYPKLVDSQRLADFQFIPLSLLWRKHTRGEARSLKEYFFGLGHRPTVIGKIWYLIRARRDSEVRSLPAFTLDQLSQKDSQEDIESANEAQRIAKSARRRILVETYKEMHVSLGPTYRSPHSVKETLLQDQELRTVIDEVAASENADRKKIMARAYKYLNEIQSNYRFRTIELFYVFLSWLFTKVFDGVDINEDELKKVRELMKNKPVIFIASHRSHLDYLVLPYKLFERNMVVPHIVAGINMAFWPIGGILRSGGAFFIRRSFRGNPLYATCLKKYIEYLIKNRFNFLFFIEGTRSRSGKMLPPAYGILKIILERYDQKICDDIAFIPVSIVYDKVPEESSYSKELGGAKKTKESASALLKSRSLFTRKIGKVYLRFADALFARTLKEAQESAEISNTLTLQKTAFSVSKNIAKVSPITPKSIISTILLSHPKIALSLGELLRLCEMLAEYCIWGDYPLSLDNPGEFKRACEQTLRNLQKSGMVGTNELTVPKLFYCEEKKRRALNYYKNNAIHCYVNPAIMFVAFCATLHESENDSELNIPKVWLAKALSLRNILKFEFFFSPSAEFTQEIHRNACYFFGDNNWKTQNLPTLVEKLKSTLPNLDDVSMFTRIIGELIESYHTAIQSLYEYYKGTEDKKIVIQRMVKFALAQQTRGEIVFPESISIQNYANCLLLLDNQNFIKMVKEKDGTWIHVTGTTEQLELLLNETTHYKEIIDTNIDTFLKKYT